MIKVARRILIGYSRRCRAVIRGFGQIFARSAFNKKRVCVFVAPVPEFCTVDALFVAFGKFRLFSTFGFDFLGQLKFPFRPKQFFNLFDSFRECLCVFPSLRF